MSLKLFRYAHKPTRSFCANFHPDREFFSLLKLTKMLKIGIFSDIKGHHSYTITAIAIKRGSNIWVPTRHHFVSLHPTFANDMSAKMAESPKLGQPTPGTKSLLFEL